MKGSKLTRRQLAGVVLAAAAAAQTPAPQAAAPASPDDELKAAREQNQHTAEALAKQEIPVTAEPAFHFTA